ncbi:MAG: hypothetical protein ACOCRK_08390 [bacterium]
MTIDLSVLIGIIGILITVIVGVFVVRSKKNTKINNRDVLNFKDTKDSNITINDVNLGIKNEEKN